MLRIELREREEEIKIGDLFESMSLNGKELIETDNQWPIEILSFDGYYSIDGYRTVEPQKTIRIKTECGKELEGAFDHIVLEHSGWMKLRDLKIGSELISHDNYNYNSPVVASIEINETKQRLYDFQVATAHSFMTNNILSHNSHCLVSMGASSMKCGKNVLHYTFELSEHAVGLRYDSNLCHVSVSDIYDNKSLVIDQYKKEGLGKLIIKEYPTGSASVTTIRNHIEKLSLKNFKPHLILIDYADIMRSTRSYDSVRHELKLIYEELRNLSMEMKIPIWTASQANRDSANSEVVGLENMAEAYGKAMVADVVISISRKAEEKSTGVARLFIAKNRAGRDGILFPIMIDTAQSRFTMMSDEEMSLGEAKLQSKNEGKALLLKKWKEVSQNSDDNEG